MLAGVGRAAAAETTAICVQYVLTFVEFNGVRGGFHEAGLHLVAVATEIFSTVLLLPSLGVGAMNLVRQFKLLCRLSNTNECLPTFYIRFNILHFYTCL